jgi:hypothetical protein
VCSSTYGVLLPFVDHWWSFGICFVCPSMYGFLLSFSMIFLKKYVFERQE